MKQVKKVVGSRGNTNDTDNPSGMQSLAKCKAIQAPMEDLTTITLSWLHKGVSIKIICVSRTQSEKVQFKKSFPLEAP